MTDQAAEYDKLRFNSHAKHYILQDYLLPWGQILGKWNAKLNYYDCFAGPGRYLWKDTPVDGSPIVSLRVCRDLLMSDIKSKPSGIALTFIDEDSGQLSKLATEIDKFAGALPLPVGLDVTLYEYNSQSFVRDLLQRATDLAPSFFFIDPYSHPFSLETMKSIMARSRTEIMLNFMYYQIIRDLKNPQKEELCDAFFFPDKQKDVIRLFFGHSKFDELKILEYLHRRIGARYYIPFWVRFGPDEKVKAHRVKYFLIHYSNSFTAFELMLSTMWKHSDPGHPLSISDGQPVLFPLRGRPELRYQILEKYGGSGVRLSFEDFIEENWRWYFLEKHYRAVLKEMEKEGKLRVERVTSQPKRGGLAGKDILVF